MASSQIPGPGAELSRQAKSDLSVLVHFLLLFREPLGLSQHDLLHAQAESSLLAQTGRPFDALAVFLTTASKTSRKAFQTTLSIHQTAAESLSHLRDLVDSNAHHSDLRKFVTADDGRVLPSARLRVGARDATGVSYTWLRGPDGCCSDRIIAASSPTASRVLRTEDAAQVVSKLESGQRRRHDLLAAAWLRERADRSIARCTRLEKIEEERVKKQERMQKRAGLVGGVQVDVFTCGRGRRERKRVCYEEEEDEEDEEEDEVVEDEECEFVMESGEETESDQSGDEDFSEEEGVAGHMSHEDGWKMHPAAVGRRRVRSYARETDFGTTWKDGRSAIRKSARLLRSSGV